MIVHLQLNIRNPCRVVLTKTLDCMLYVVDASFTRILHHYKPVSRTHIRIRGRARIYVHVDTYICTYVPTCVRMFICTYTYPYTHIYKYTYNLTCIHIHLHMWSQVWRLCDIDGFSDDGSCLFVIVTM